MLLLNELIDQGHEVFRGKASAEVLKARMRAAVEARYPENANDKHLPDMEKKGSIPPSILIVLQENEAKRRDELRKQESEGKKRGTGPLIDDKNATPADASARIETCLADVRPQSFTIDRDSTSSSDPAALRAGALERYGDLIIQTGSKFINQFHSKYFSQVFPFVFPRMVSGPDYNPEEKWRRKPESPVVTSKEFTRGIARRVEALCRNDWTAIPAIRSVDFSWTAQHTMSMLTPFIGKRDTPAATRANEMVQAAKGLLHALWHGFVGTGVHRVPIAGDTTRLPNANGLSALEKELARSMDYKARNLPGTQQIRQEMGHTQFGARVAHGDSIFLTVSPNPQFSALTLRLSRYRANDPCIAGEDDVQKCVRRNCGRHNPSLEAQNNESGVRSEDAHTTNLPIPPYEQRRIASARDPLAVCDAYAVHIRVRLARLLGVRMCPICPRCNAEGAPHPCQDKFGSNMMPMGGILGACTGFGGATEHQQSGVPHFHCQAHIACIYQFGTMAEIAQKISDGLFSAESVCDYQAWLHREEPFLPEQHEASKDHLEAAKRQGFAESAHDDMCTTPAYLAEDAAATMWDKPPATEAAARAEGARYKDEYFKDLQYIYSRVQHHYHRKTKSGGYAPFRTCLAKHKKGVCKHNFPKELLLTAAMRVICKGNAKKFGLRISGRRNSFGSILGRRTCVWQSGTTPGFAAIFRSNTHTQPNHRLPPTEETHDAEFCKRSSCVKNPKLIKVTCKLAQRAQREAAGYYCGYTFKRQPVGKKQLQAAAECLNYVEQGMQDKRPGQQWHRITNRVLQDCQHRCMLRTAPEEFNLAANSNDHDVTSAEFIRTYRSENFPGLLLLKRLESEQSNCGKRSMQKQVPVRRGDVGNAPIFIRCFDDIYGYRGTNRKVYYLSPWEFLMYWEVLPLRPPSGDDGGGDTKWTPEFAQGGRPEGKDCEPGRHYVVDETLGDAPDVVLLSPCTVLRHQWYLRRRQRPMVPAPSNTPMPDKQKTAEGKNRLFSVYMRPWVLDHALASQHVPHLCDLDRAAAEADSPPVKRRRLVGKQRPRGQAPRSFTAAWKWYVRGNIVSRHAARLITQFMAACCGKSTTRDHMEADPDTHADGTAPNTSNTIPLSRVHAVLDRATRFDGTGATGTHDESGTEDEQLRLSEHVRCSLSVTDDLWRRDIMEWPETELNRQGNTEEMSTHKEPAKESQKAVASKRVVNAYVKLNAVNVERCFSELMSRSEHPNEEQLGFLRSVAARCADEAREFHGKDIDTKTSEPFRMGLLGSPGAGKSRCIKWVQEFFEECLGWKNGVQFQCLASQNTMAALIRGTTLHSWAKIPPINLNEGSSEPTKGDLD